MTDMLDHARLIPAVCLPPLLPEVLATMADSTPEDITNGELYRSLGGLRSDMDKGFGSAREELRASTERMRGEVADLKSQMGRMVYQDVFAAEQRAVIEREATLRVELAAARNEARADTEAARSMAASARTLAWWVLGLLLTAIVTGVVAIAVNLIRH